MKKWLYLVLSLHLLMASSPAFGVEKQYVSVREGAKAGKQAAKEVQQVKKTALPEYLAGKISESKLMDAAEKWLGRGYKDMGNGRYVSKDGMRQFRYGKHETKNLGNHHAHFETYDKPLNEGGKLIEKSVVEVIK